MLKFLRGASSVPAGMNHLAPTSGELRIGAFGRELISVPKGVSVQAPVREQDRMVRCSQGCARRLGSALVSCGSKALAKGELQLCWWPLCRR